MDTKVRRAALWIAGAAATACVAIVTRILNLEFHLVGALAAIALIAALIISERVPRGWAIAGLMACLVILPIGILMQPRPKLPSTDDLTLELVSDKIVGDRVYGHISLNNGSTKSLRITDSFLTVSSSYAAGDTNPERVVKPGGSTEFVIDHPNDLALRGGEVVLDFHTAFGDLPQKPQPAEAAFTVPVNPTVARKIPSSRCCKMQEKDLYQVGLRDAERRLDLDHSYFEIPALSETEIDGSPMDISIPRARHRFYVSDGLVRFQSLQGGAWRELKLPFQQSTTGKHFVKFGWNDQVGLSWLIVDNAAVAGDTKHDRVVSLAPRELLAHEL